MSGFGVAAGKAPKVRLWPTMAAGMFAVFGLLGGMILWAHLTRISGAVISPGFVAVETKVKTVQHFDGGIVAQILVKDSDRVQAGDLLIRLESTELSAQIATIRAQLAEALAIRARLEAERAELPSIVYPKQFWDIAPAADGLQHSKVQEFTFLSRRNNRVGQVRILENKIEQIQKDSDGTRYQVTSKQHQIQLLEKDLASLQTLVKQGLVTRPRIAQMERDLLVLKGEEGRLVSDLSKSGTAAEEVKLQIFQINKQFEEQIATDYKDVQPRILELTEKFAALKVKLQLVEIRAPISGHIHNLTVVTKGGVVSPGKDILQIIPDRDRLIVEGKIAPSDLDQVKPGGHAFVKLSAFEARATPQLNGVVSTVSPAQSVDTATRAVYFNVSVEVSETELQKLKSDQTLRPGMPAELFITTVDRTALEYLMKPVWDQFDRSFKER